MLVNTNIPWLTSFPLSAGRLVSPPVSLPADKVKEIFAIRISNMVFLLAHLLSHFLGKLSTAT